MKVLLLMGVLLASLVSHSQETVTQTFTNHMYFSPFQLFNNTFQMGFEKDQKNASLLILFAATLTKKQGDFGPTSEEGFSGEIQYRFYLYDFKQLGTAASTYLNYNVIYYFAPAIGYSNLNKIYDACVESRTSSYEEFVTRTQKTNLSHLGMLFGSKMIIARRITLDMYVGTIIQLANTTITKEVSNGLDKYGESDYYCYPQFDLANTLWPSDKTGIFPKVGMQLGMNF